MSLTAPSIGALMLAAVLGIVGVWSGGVDAFPWWRLVVALLVLGLIYELLSVRRVRLSARWRAGRLFLGRTEKLELDVSSAARRPLDLELAPVLPAALVPADDEPRRVVVPADAAATATIDARPVALGVHAWPRISARVKGPLGLAWWGRAIEPAAEVEVLPDTLGGRARVTGSAETGSAVQATLGGARELHHLRPYRSGDPLHAIDWKATARASRLITRVFSEDQHLEIVIAVDAGRTSRTEIGGMSQLGHYTNLAARFAEYCVTSDDRVGLVAFADRPLAVVAPGRGIESVTRIRRALAALESQPVESDVLEAALRIRRLVRHRCLTVVLTDLYESTATGRLVESTRLLTPKHALLMVGLVSDEVGELAGREASDWLDPYRALAAREYLRHVRANVARLGQLGAFALTARPGELDRKVMERYRLLRAQHRV